MLGFRSGLESLSQLVSERSGLLVTSSAVSGSNNRPDTQVNRLDTCHCSLGAVVLFGRLEGRRHLLGQRDQRIPLDLGYASAVALSFMRSTA